MTLAILLIIAVVNIGLFAGGVYAYVATTRKVKAYIVQGVKAFEDFATSQDENTPSDFAKLTDSIASVFAQRIGTTVQAHIKGAMGGTMKAVNAELEQEAISGNPQAAIIAALPKSLRKNPLAQVGLTSIIQKILSGSGPGSGNNGSNSQAKFNL